MRVWISEWVSRDRELLYIYIYVGSMSRVLKIWVNVSKNTYVRLSGDLSHCGFGRFLLSFLLTLILLLTILWNSKNSSHPLLLNFCFCFCYWLLCVWNHDLSSIFPKLSDGCAQYTIRSEEIDFSRFFRFLSDRKNTQKQQQQQCT